MTEKIRWGFLATGWMAEKFAEGMSVVPDAEIAAVGSRALDTADAFGDRFGIPRRYGSYAELVADPDIDIVYVSSPNPFHREHTLLALEAGKPVLCEKPFALNAGEAEEMIAAARSRKLFLMEAMWARFIPGMVKVREWLAAGAIGEVRMLDAEFGFRSRFDPTQRLFNPAWGAAACSTSASTPSPSPRWSWGRTPTASRRWPRWERPGSTTRPRCCSGTLAGRSPCSAAPCAPPSRAAPASTAPRA